MEEDPTFVPARVLGTLDNNTQITHIYVPILGPTASKNLALHEDHSTQRWLYTTCMRERNNYGQGSTHRQLKPRVPSQLCTPQYTFHFSLNADSNG